MRSPCSMKRANSWSLDSGLLACHVRVEHASRVRIKGGFAESAWGITSRDVLLLERVHLGVGRFAFGIDGCRCAGVSWQRVSYSEGKSREPQQFESLTLR